MNLHHFLNWFKRHKKEVMFMAEFKHVPLPPDIRKKTMPIIYKRSDKPVEWKPSYTLKCHHCGQAMDPGKYLGTITCDDCLEQKQI